MEIDYTHFGLFVVSLCGLFCPQDVNSESNRLMVYHTVRGDISGWPISHTHPIVDQLKFVDYVSEHASKRGIKITVRNDTMPDWEAQVVSPYGTWEASGPSPMEALYVALKRWDSKVSSTWQPEKSE